MPDADLLTGSAWVWPQSYWREGESAWLTAHKFGFLNGLDKVALGRALASLDPTGQQVAKSAPRHLFGRIASERREGERPGARDDALRAFTLEELLAEHLDKVVHPVVRFCPACIAQWFHASIFQLAGLRRCVWPPPYWRVLLRDDQTSSRCAGYDAACVDDLLRRLAKISLLGDYPWGIGVGGTQRAVWGQEMAAYRMKLRPGVAHAPTFAGTSSA